MLPAVSINHLAFTLAVLSRHQWTALGARTTKLIELEPKSFNLEEADFNEIISKLPFFSGNGTNPGFRDSGSTDVDENDLPDGWICMKKVVMEEQTEWDYEERCHHITSQNCYEAFKTVFKPQKVETCEEKFRKDCFITYKDLVKSETVEVCDEEVKRDCDAPDAKEVCSTQYETVCETRYKEFEVEEDLANCEVKKVEWCKPDPVTGEDTYDCVQVPKTVCNPTTETTRKVIPHVDCNAKPKEVCGPETCPIVKGERKCRDEVRHLIQEVPEEECNMVPQRSCTEEVKIVPSLVPEEKCVDVPKEVCATARVNPTKVMKPVIKRWCGPVDNGDDDNTGDCSALCSVDAGIPQTDSTLVAQCKADDTCEDRCNTAFGSSGTAAVDSCQTCASDGCDSFVASVVCVFNNNGVCPPKNSILLADGQAEAQECPGICAQDAPDSCRTSCDRCDELFSDRVGLCRRCYSAGCNTIPLMGQCTTFGGCFVS